MQIVEGVFNDLRSDKIPGVENPEPAADKNLAFRCQEGFLEYR